MKLHSIFVAQAKGKEHQNRKEMEQAIHLHKEKKTGV